MNDHEDDLRHNALVAAEALRQAADAWQQGAWADTPRRADRVADRLAAAQYPGDWLRARADRIAQTAADAPETSESTTEERGDG